ncbi:hypothetical protein JTB14_034199 [Gonioctena quinquepunctata]|nr:hypothetical protein JTB14_034199 [Gonioctena quinquepunctata]
MFSVCVDSIEQENEIACCVAISFSSRIDQDKFLHEFYSEFHEGHLDMNNSINISGGNWITIEYFPELPTVFGNYAINKLAIRNASVQHIHDDAFKHHQSLKSLDLSWNKLEDIEFVKYLPTSLESLNLAGNNIVHIENVFERLSLQHIDMSYNNISIPDFHPLWNSLDLSHNKITQFNETMLGPSKSLNLSYNNLSVVEIVYDKDYLNLSNNNISRFIIENNQGSGPLHCEEIHLSLPEHDFMMRHYDGLRVIHKVKLQGELNLVSNLLPIILEKNYGSVDIHIDISYSTTTDNSRYQFKNIYATRFGNLKQLFLQHNNITKVGPYIFKGLSILEILRLDFNNISALDHDSFSGLNNLRELHLEINSLTSLPLGVFQYLPNLMMLNLSYNKFESFETGVFSNLVGIRVLDLRNTYLTKMEEVGLFFSMRNLRRLYLDRNNLKQFNFRRLLTNLKNIRYMGISHNKWQCKDLSVMIENLNNKSINYNPAVPAFDNDNIDGIEYPRWRFFWKTGGLRTSSILSKMMASTTFLLQLQNYPKDIINNEMVEFLQPYFEMEDYNMDTAKRVCGDVAGLLSWTKAMAFFHSVNREVLPLKANLTMQEARLKVSQ